MSDGNDETDPDLDARLAEWRKEQYRVASEVVIEPDNDESPKDVSFEEASDSGRYKSLPVNNDQYSDKLFGGVDVSFPEKEGDPAVAVYCILQRDGKVVYHDSEIFSLTLPYVSSYLSFREIDPLERLVKKQTREKPELTPYAILVDGNGVLHKRRAGIACFLGVRTGIRTIGVGKTLYCQAGLSTTLVKNGIDKAVEELVRRTRNDAEIHCRMRKERGLILDHHCISAECEESPIETAALLDDDVSKMDRGGHIKELGQCCQGIAIKLKGDDGKIWASALVGHGGQIGNSRRATCGTKNPIFVSVGHKISLQEAVHICASLSQARIPEPVRQADLSGRRLLREASRH